MGPLGTSCAAVSNAAWYTQAGSMSDGATYTGASTISSGYIGIQHMMHQATNNIVVGGELEPAGRGALGKRGTVRDATRAHVVG